MTVRKKICRAFSTLTSLALAFSLVGTAFAHPGRTDADGGHNDYSNRSGLGPYHFHCGGYPAHLHKGGHCPRRDVFPSKVTVSSSKKTLSVGESTSISASVYPRNACDKYVELKSSNPSVVQVRYGTAIAVGGGTATVYATTFNGKTASIKFVVKEIVAESVKISGYNDDSEPIHIGDSINLTATTVPAKIDNPTISWSSSNPEVATVKNGKVSTHGIGNVTITAKTSNGKKDSVSFEIKEIVADRMEIIPPNKLIDGEEAELITHFYPWDTIDRRVTWTSSDERIAVVDAHGKITAKSVGCVTVTAKQKDVSASVEINIFPKPVERISVTAHVPEDLTAGDCLQMHATIYPSDATYQDVIWSTSNSYIATIDENGLLTTKLGGTVVVTAQSQDGIKETLELKIKHKINPIVATGGGVALVGIGRKVLQKKKSST